MLFDETANTDCTVVLDLHTCEGLATMITPRAHVQNVNNNPVSGGVVVCTELLL